MVREDRNLVDGADRKRKMEEITSAVSLVSEYIRKVLDAEKDGNLLMTRKKLQAQLKMLEIAGKQNHLMHMKVLSQGERRGFDFLIERAQILLARLRGDSAFTPDECLLDAGVLDAVHLAIDALSVAERKNWRFMHILSAYAALGPKEIQQRLLVRTAEIAQSL